MIEARDVASIYDVPRAYHEAGLDREVLAAFGIEPAPKPDMTRWNAVTEPDRQPRGRGHDRDRRQVHGHEGRLQVADRGADARRHRQPGRASSSTGSRARSSRATIRPPHLEHVHGILVPGGFGQRGAEGKILAARFARERKVPYFGICFGMQMAVIEAARSLAGIEDAELDRVRPLRRARSSA